MRPRRLDRSALRARQRALRDELRRKKQPSRRRRWLWVLLALLLLMCLIPLRSCEEEAPVPGAVVVEAGIAAPVEVEPGPPPPIEPVKRFDRPRYTPPPPDPVPWLEAWRLQVAARGPRLAACFVGARHPGALRWTTRVEPASGLVSDHTLEPVLDTEPVTSSQRACVLGVLTDPPYRLASGDPSRVGIVIEF